jgi:cell shape-determining protein MreC
MSQRDSSVPPLDRELLERLQQLTGLSRSTLQRVAETIVDYFNETTEDFVQRRHAELRKQRIRNEEAFQRISEELAQRLVAAPRLSLRQLRRIVYG